MEDRKFVLPTTNPLTAEEMEEDTDPPDQVSEPPQPARAEGEEEAETTEVTESQEACPSPATTQSTGASSCAAQTAWQEGKSETVQRPNRRRGATDKDRPRKKGDKSKHRGKMVPTPVNPRG